MLSLLIAAFAADPNIKNPELTADELAATESTSALGQILFDARMPCEIRVDGRTMGQLFVKGRLTVDLPIGPHDVLVITNGEVQTVAIEVVQDARTMVLVGRTGLTATNQLFEEDAGGEATVELRVSGNAPMLVAVDEQRWRLNARSSEVVKIPLGEHTMTVHSGDGHVLFARGRIALTRNDIAIVQLSEGRLPEVSGVGAAFHPGR